MRSLLSQSRYRKMLVRVILPLPGQGCKHVNMNEYTRTAACSLQPHTARIHWLSIRVSCLQDVLWGFAFRFVLNEIFPSVHVQWWRVQNSAPPVSLFIFTVFCGRKYPSRTQWLENATISFCCELLSSLMNAVKDHWGAGGLAGPRRGDPAAVMVL